MGGRPRTPTALLVLSGTQYAQAQGAERAATEPPRAHAVLDQPPDHLDTEEREAWATFARHASNMRVLTQEDAAALETLAVAWVQAQHLRDYFRNLRKVDPLHVFSYVTLNQAGAEMLRARPEVETLKNLDHQILQLLGRFGLTPADRSRVAVLGGGVPPPNDPDKEFT